MGLKKFCLRFLSLAAIALPAASMSANEYKPFVTDAEAKIEIREFARMMAKDHQFDEESIFLQLSSMQHRQDIIQRITKPAEAMPWFKYRKIFIKDKRINDGVAFWNQHKETLDKAQETFGVDPAIIVGIIGVETFYGRIQGDFPVLESLHTLGFYYPKRSKFFRSELAQYYLLAREQGWPLESVKGSYAGAMGMGQFISSSYRHYGYDFNDNGKVNLFDDPVDMIGSVANYFKKHGWKKGGFVVKPVTPDQAQKSFVQQSLKLTRSPAQLKSAGFDVSQVEQHSKKAGVFDFELADGGAEYWLGGDNFYVITRYNHNEMYALAVYQLSQAVKAAREKAAGKSAP